MNSANENSDDQAQSRNLTESSLGTLLDKVGEIRGDLHTALGATFHQSDPDGDKRAEFGAPATSSRLPFGKPEFQDVKARAPGTYDNADLVGIWRSSVSAHRAYRFSLDGGYEFVVGASALPGSYTIDGDRLTITMTDEAHGEVDERVIKIDGDTMTICALDGYVYDRATKASRTASTFGNPRTETADGPEFQNVDGRVHQVCTVANLTGRWRDIDLIDEVYIFDAGGPFERTTDEFTYRGTYAIDGDILTINLIYDSGRQDESKYIVHVVTDDIVMCQDDGFVVRRLKRETPDLMEEAERQRAAKAAKLAANKAAANLATSAMLDAVGGYTSSRAKSPVEWILKKFLGVALGTARNAQEKNRQGE